MQRNKLEFGNYYQRRDYDDDNKVIAVIKHMSNAIIVVPPRKSASEVHNIRIIERYHAI